MCRNGYFGTFIENSDTGIGFLDPDFLTKCDFFVQCLYNTPSLGMAYCLAKPQLALMQLQPHDPC